jgi:hypothetical protein
MMIHLTPGQTIRQYTGDESTDLLRAGRNPQEAL